MALIQKFNLITKENPRLHRKVSKACIFQFSHNGNKYIQIDTYGSDDREKLGVISQSIQLDEQSAKYLLKFLKDSFQS